MIGSVEVIEQQTLTKMPQEAASAWAYFDGAIVGAGYKPVAFVGTQLVKGTNYVFLAEQTFITAEPVRHIAVVKVNAFNGNYSIAGIEQIF